MTKPKILPTLTVLAIIAAIVLFVGSAATAPTPLTAYLTLPRSTEFGLGVLGIVVVLLLWYLERKDEKEGV